MHLKSNQYSFQWDSKWYFLLPADIRHNKLFSKTAAIVGLGYGLFFRLHICLDVGLIQQATRSCHCEMPSVDYSHYYIFISDAGLYLSVHWTTCGSNFYPAFPVVSHFNKFTCTYSILIDYCTLSGFHFVVQNMNLYQSQNARTLVKLSEVNMPHLQNMHMPAYYCM